MTHILAPEPTTAFGDVDRIERKLVAMRASFDEHTVLAPAEAKAAADDYLLLTLAGEVYAYPVAHALEIVETPPIVPVPNVAPAVLGVINVRGRIVSVTTIHGALGLPPSDIGPRSRIIVTKDLPFTTGILADGVDTIAGIVAADVRPLPVTIAARKAELLTGQLRIGGRFVLLLNAAGLCVADSLQTPRGE